MRIRALPALLVLTLFVVQVRSANPQSVCLGDCDGEGTVTVDEVVTLVNIALGLSTITACEAGDSDGGRQITVDEILTAVSHALTGCTATLAGLCRIPGPAGGEGLIACSTGTRVALFRCDALDGCLEKENPPRSLLGEGRVQAPPPGGLFSIAYDPREGAAAQLIVEAEVDEAVIFRTLDFGSASGNRAGLGIISFGQVANIDPDSEGATRAVGTAGLENVPAEDAGRLIERVRDESIQGKIFAGQTPKEAADEATDIAFDIFFVAPERITISPDGRHVYVSSFVDDAIASFVRDGQSGLLTPSQLLPVGEGDENGLMKPSGIAVSPDGLNLYVTGAGRPSPIGSFVGEAIAVFARQAETGELEQVQVETEGLDVPLGVAVSPEGKHVYVNTSDGVAVYERSMGGRLGFLQALQDSRLGTTFGVTLSPDGRHVYFAGGEDRPVIGTAARDVQTGLLDARPLLETMGFGFLEANPIAFSPDGAHAYMPGQGLDPNDFVGSVALLERDRERGTLGFVDSTQIGQFGEFLGTNIVVSQDGAHVYVTGVTVNLSTFLIEAGVALFRRDAESGRLSFVETVSFLDRETQQGEIEGLVALRGSPAGAISPDGSQFYLTSPFDEAVGVFSRDPATGRIRRRQLARAPILGRVLVAPPNDDCRDAEEISNPTFLAFGIDTTAATVEDDDPSLSCGSGGQQGHSVWYRFTAPANGNLMVTTARSEYDTVLAVHTGTCGHLVELRCDDDGLNTDSIVVVPVVEDVTYYVQITNFGVRPGGILNLIAQFGTSLCNQCGGDGECGAVLSCAGCVEICSGATQRCSLPEGTVCTDGVYCEPGSLFCTD